MGASFAGHAGLPPRRHVSSRWIRRLHQPLVIAVCAAGAVLHAHPASAALTISGNTWHVIGLDSNDVATGPNVFPVAAVVCNTGPSAATNLTTTFSWDSSNVLINLTGPAVVNRGTLDAGACLQSYYWVAVTRTPAAYTTTRRYHITAAADGGLMTATPIRELYVERLISQNRNTSQTPSGPTTVFVGQTYTFTWTGNTAPQGYEQVTNFISLDDRIFRMLSVQSTYATGPSPIPGVYNDACRWNADPASAGYRSCGGSGKAGGPITMTVTVQVIGTGSAMLAGAIYDFSGASFHYNADFGRNALPVTAIEGSADLSITKSNGVDRVAPGSTTTYAVVVTNAGPGAADGAIVSDPAVAGLSKTAVSCAAAGGAVCPGSPTVSGLESGIAIPKLPAGGSLTFTVTALVTASSGSVANTATIAAPPGLTDPNPSNNSATDTDVVTSTATHADLAITKTNFVSTLNAGSTTTYTVVVTNNGPDAVSGALVTDSAPDGLTFGNWTCTGTGGAQCPASGSGNLGVAVTLPPGSSVTFRIDAAVSATAGGTIANTATLTPPAGTTDPNPANNSATDTDVISSGASQADLDVTKTNGVSTLTPGSTTIYTVIVRNDGPAAVTGATVMDTAPEGLAFGDWTCTGAAGGVCPASGSGNVDVTVTLPVGGTATFRINATVAPQASGSITNIATVTLPDGMTDPRTANNTASDTDAVLAQRIGIAKRAGSPRQIGPTSFEVPYTLVVSNLGPIRATNVQVTDAFDRTFVAGAPALSLVGTPTSSALGGAAAAECLVNSSFSGTGSATALLVGNTNLEPGQGCAITVTVRVTYPTVASIPADEQLNTAIATTHVSPGGERIARDESDSGSDPAGTNPGEPGDTGGSDDPTPVLLPGPSSPGVPEPLPSPPISVTKRAAITAVEIGDAITYSVHIRNSAGSFLPATSVEDRLPFGFSYIAGSAQLTVGATTVRLADPAGAETRVFVFALPHQAAASEAVLTYLVRTSAGAQQGNGTNCVRATASDGRQSNESCARVFLSGGVFTQEACIAGRVFVDASGNKVQDRQEPGVSGVRLYLEDGTAVLTDGSGSFSYCGVRAGTRVLKVDRSTLPAGAELVPGRNRQALDAGSTFLDVKFGEVHRADFVIAAADAAVLAEIERRRVASQAGTSDEESQAAVSGPSPDTPLLAVGVVEGIVSLTSLSRASALGVRPGDTFEEELRRFSRSFNDGKGLAAGRAAMFMHGTVRRDYRVSLSFDSERPNRGVLFRDIRPEAFYPILGDESEKRFEARTSRRLYAKVERGGSHVLFGDFITSVPTPATDLGIYARTLTGVQHRFERTRLAVNVFATRDTFRQVVDEIGGRGISGPYSVSNPNGVSGTEKVEIITRDRNQPAVILKTEPQTRFLDYEFEPFSGRVLFRRPVPSMDEHLNPVSVRITYEVDAGGARHWIGGIDGRLQLASSFEIGGSWAQDDSPLTPYELASVNATARLGTHTTIVAEAARTSATLNTNPFNRLFTPNLGAVSGEAEGEAARVELTHESRGVRARVYGGVSDPTFYNPAATLNGGRAEAGVLASYQLPRRFRLHGELIRSHDRVTGGSRRGGRVAVESTFRSMTLDLGLRHVRESAEPAQGSSAGLIQPFGTTTAPGFGFSPIGNQIDPVSGLPIFTYGRSPELSAGPLAPAGEAIEATTIKARLTSSIRQAWKAYIEGEHDVTGADRYMAAAGGEFRAAERARLYLRHELIASLDGVYGLREGQRSQRTVFGVASAYSTSGEVFSEYRMHDAISGREAQAAIGLRHAWKVREGIRLSTGLERLNPIRSAADAATAASFGAEFTRSANFKGTSRLEWRREGTNDSWLSTVGAARRLSQDWTMLARNYYQLTHLPVGADQTHNRFSVGAAYREAERNRRNLLSRYELKFEALPQPDAAGALQERRVQTVSTHGDIRRAQPWTLSGQYAGKWVQEQLDPGPASYAGHLVSGRAGYDVTGRIDVGALTSVMWSGSDDRSRKALGAEIGLLLWENTWLSVGYNVTGFSDRDFNDVLSASSTTRGFFIRLRLKFDEDLFRRSR